MASFDDTKDPYRGFLPPGTVRLSGPVLKLARDFSDAVGRMKSGGRWIISFDWATAQRVREAPDAPWQDMGPGLGMGARERHEVPAVAIQRIDGIDIAISIPEDVLQMSTEKLIDRDDTKLFKLTLR